jgi:hypothetical protein
MSRIIITRKMVSSFPPGLFTIREDPWYSTIIKLIPAEIISVYFAVFNLIKVNKQRPDNNDILQLIVFGLFLLITPLYLKRMARIESVKQIVFCSIAFMLWVLSLGGPVEGITLAGYSTQFLGSVILPVFTLLAPFIYQKTEKSLPLSAN